MTIYILKEILSNQYNRSDEARYNRAIVFVIQNTINGNLALFQAKIKQCLQSISFMVIESEIAALPQLLNDIGVANPSEFTLDQIPSDFMYLSKIFD